MIIGAQAVLGAGPWPRTAATSTSPAGSGSALTSSGGSAARRWLSSTPSTRRHLPPGYPDADLYQLLAYCTILGLRHGHLVYTRGDGEPARHTIRRSGIQLVKPVWPGRKRPA